LQGGCGDHQPATCSGVAAAVRDVVGPRPRLATVLFFAGFYGHYLGGIFDAAVLARRDVSGQR